jgi:hypothetical protein
VQTPTVVVINALLSLGVLTLSSVLAVLHLSSEIRLEDTPSNTEGFDSADSAESVEGRRAIQTHVIVLLALTVGLLASFNWFIGSYQAPEDVENDSDEDSDEQYVEDDEGRLKTD